MECNIGIVELYYKIAIASNFSYLYKLFSEVDRAHKELIFSNHFQIEIYCFIVIWMYWTRHQYKLI